MYFDLFIDQPIMALIFGFLFSVCIGSFLNVVIYRLPIMMENEWQQPASSDNAPKELTINLLLPHSHCSHCKTPIHWYHNLPLLSYFLLRGQCHHCHQKISIRYPFIELLSGICGAASIYHFGFNELGVAFAIFCWILICLSAIDLQHQLLPDRLTLLLLWIGLIVNSYSIFSTLHLAVFGAIAGYLTLWTVFWAFKLCTGREGMGYGDFKLLAALGAWVGINLLPVVITLSAFIASITGIVLVLSGKQQKDHPIPFGPYLAFAGAVALLWGDQITNTYLQLF